MNDLREIKYIFLSAKLLLFLNKMNFHMKVNLINKINNVKKKLYKTSLLILVWEST